MQTRSSKSRVEQPLSESKQSKTKQNSSTKIKQTLTSSNSIDQLEQFFTIGYAEGLSIDKQQNLNAIIKWEGYDKSENSIEPFDNLCQNDNFWCIQNFIQNLSFYKQFGQQQFRGRSLYIDDKQFTIGKFKLKSEEQNQNQNQKDEVGVEKLQLQERAEELIKEKKQKGEKDDKDDKIIKQLKQETIQIETNNVLQNQQQTTSRQMRMLARDSKKQDLLVNCKIEVKKENYKTKDQTSSDYVAEKEIVDEDQKSIKSQTSLDPQVKRKSNNQQDIINKLLELEGTQLNDYLQKKFKFFLMKSRKTAQMNLLNRYLKLIGQNMVIQNSISKKNGYGVIPQDKAIFIASHKLNIVKDRKSGNLQMKLMFELEFGFDEFGMKLKNNYAKPYRLYKTQRHLFLQYIELHKEDLGFLFEIFKKYRDQKKYIGLKLRASRKVFFEALKSKL